MTGFESRSDLWGAYRSQLRLVPDSNVRVQGAGTSWSIAGIYLVTNRIWRGTLPSRSRPRSQELTVWGRWNDRLRHTAELAGPRCGTLRHIGSVGFVVHSNSTRLMSVRSQAWYPYESGLTTAGLRRRPPPTPSVQEGSACSRGTEALSLLLVKEGTSCSQGAEGSAERARGLTPPSSLRRG